MLLLANVALSAPAAPMTGFHQLWVDPEQTAQTLAPAVSARWLGAPPLLATLPIQNESSSWAVVVVAGVRIGEIGPNDVAYIPGVAAGLYQVEFELPNGFIRVDTVLTEGPS